MSPRLQPRLGSVPLWAVAIVAAWLAGAAAWQALRPPDSDTTLCLFRNATGVPCPTCGTTRALLTIGRGDLLEGLACNPVTVLALAAGLTWLVVQLAFPHRARVRVPDSAWWTLLGLLLVNWVYVLWSGQ